MLHVSCLWFVRSGSGASSDVASSSAATGGFGKLAFGLLRRVRQSSGNPPPGFWTAQICKAATAPILRPVGIGAGHWPGGSHQANKVAQIDRIFATYPHLSFILIGDSKQHDVEIYAEIAERHPSRVLGIYIRDVTEAERDLKVEAVLRPATARGVRIAYGPDLIKSAEDAATAGWIAASALSEIRAAVTNPDGPGA